MKQTRAQYVGRRGGQDGAQRQGDRARDGQRRARVGVHVRHRHDGHASVSKEWISDKDHRPLKSEGETKGEMQRVGRLADGGPEESRDLRIRSVDQDHDAREVSVDLVISNCGHGALSPCLRRRAYAKLHAMHVPLCHARSLSRLFFRHQRRHDRRRAVRPGRQAVDVRVGTVQGRHRRFPHALRAAQAAGTSRA